MSKRETRIISRPNNPSKLYPKTGDKLLVLQTISTRKPLIKKIKFIKKIRGTLPAMIKVRFISSKKKKNIDRFENKKHDNK